MLHSSRGAAHITGHPEILKLTHTIIALSECLGVTGSTSKLYLGINCNICLDILKFCMLIGQLIRNANHLILTYKIVYSKWTNLKIYYFPECLLWRPDGLCLISKTNTKNRDGICASVTPAFHAKQETKTGECVGAQGPAGPEYIVLQINVL